jgi:hypothetical protein
LPSPGIWASPVQFIRSDSKTSPHYLTGVPQSTSAGVTPQANLR